MHLIERDANGVAHIVALSGGHDSTIMSFVGFVRYEKISHLVGLRDFPDRVARH